MPEPQKHHLIEFLSEKKDRLSDYCAPGINADQLINTFNTAMIRNRELASCTPESVWLACTQCAKWALDPTGYRNSAHFVPFNDKKKGVTECVLMVGYNGLIDLMIRNSDLVAIHLDLVYKGEEFEVFGGTDIRIHHKPDMTIRRVNDPVKAVEAGYCVGIFPGDIKTFITMDRTDLNKREAASKQADGAWKYNKPAMWLKSLVRNYSKWQVITPVMAEVLQHIDEYEGEDFERRKVENKAGAQDLQNRINQIDHKKADGEFAEGVIEIMNEQSPATREVLK